MATTDEKFLNGSGLSKVISWIKGLFQPKQMGTTADFQSKAVVTNSSGVISTSTVTATELGTLSGIGTKTIASQLNDKQDVLLNGDHIDLVNDVIDAHEASTSGTDSAPSVTLGVMGFALPDLTTDGTTTQDNNVNDYVTEGVRGYNSIIHLRKANPSHYGVLKLYVSTGAATDGTMTQKAITSGISDAVGDKQNKMTVGNGTAGAVTTISAGTNIGIDVSNDGKTAIIKNTYSLPTMTNTAVGGAKVHATYAGSAVQALKYCVGINSDTGEIGILPASTNQDGVMTSAMVTTLNAAASTTYVDNAISSAMTSVAKFKGVVNAYTAITGTAYKNGWYWIVGTAGTYAGEKCEVGDQIWAKADKGSAAANTDFNVVQTNIDTDVYVRDTDFLSESEINTIINTAS